MRKELFDALVSMAKLDGWKFTDDGMMSQLQRVGQFMVNADYWVREGLNYHKSADAALVVFRKVKYYGHDDLHWLDLEPVLFKIANGDLEEACIMMAPLCDKVLYKTLKS